MAKLVKVAVGCGKRKYPGWAHLDLGDYPHLDYNCSVEDLPFKDNSVDVLYASHVLSYFNRNSAKLILQEWKRVLKRGGKLYIAVPDFKAISELYTNLDYPLHYFLGPLYGLMDLGGSEIYHRTVYDESSLGELLKSSGFNRVERYNPQKLIGKIDDHSLAKIDGFSISLNLRCAKWD